ncbi:hypothetical protein HBA91_00495 [Ochrobactrum sp. MR34]|nr:hypothetical protein [Ochrobactrum sp. MR34]
MDHKVEREKMRYTRAQIRSAAIIAKEQGVSVRLEADGSLSVQPAPLTDTYPHLIEHKNIVRL